MNKNLKEYLDSDKHLPEPLRDFHDQKRLFAKMHELYGDAPHVKDKDWPNRVIGQQYVIDWFLWFMASRGYTLQRTRKKGIEFLDMP